jgi:hypothetical protein
LEAAKLGIKKWLSKIAKKVHNLKRDGPKVSLRVPES